MILAALGLIAASEWWWCRVRPSVRESRWFRALTRIVLLSGSAHFVVLIVLTVAHLDVTYLNYFHVLQLDAFIPALGEGLPATLLSWPLVIAIYLWLYRSTRDR